MNTPELIKPNRTQALGLFFMVISLFSYLGGFAWVSAYWDHELEETYRGMEIHFFPAPNVYGVKIEGLDLLDWPTTRTRSGARNTIDEMLDDPEHVETYRDFEIYKIPGYGLYYATQGTEKTANFDTLENLRNYIDAEFYPTVVMTIHRNNDDYLIYRENTEPVKYWVELDGTILEYFTSKQDAKAWVYERVDNQGTVEETEENPETPQDIDQDTGVDPVEAEAETLGEYLDSQKLMISVITGGLGVGCVVLGSIRREE